MVYVGSYDGDVYAFGEPASPVRGVYVPVKKLELLAPYIGFAILLAVAVITVVYLKKERDNRSRLSFSLCAQIPRRATFVV